MGHLNEPMFGLEEGHAYSILGVHILLDENKNVALLLICYSIGNLNLGFNSLL